MNDNEVNTDDMTFDSLLDVFDSRIVIVSKVFAIFGFIFSFFQTLYWVNKEYSDYYSGWYQDQSLFIIILLNISSYVVLYVVAIITDKIMTISSGNKTVNYYSRILKVLSVVVCFISFYVLLKMKSEFVLLQAVSIGLMIYILGVIYERSKFLAKSFENTIKKGKYNWFLISSTILAILILLSAIGSYLARGVISKDPVSNNYMLLCIITSIFVYLLFMQSAMYRYLSIFLNSYDKSGNESKDNSKQVIFTIMLIYIILLFSITGIAVLFEYALDGRNVVYFMSVVLSFQTAMILLFICEKSFNIPALSDSDNMKNILSTKTKLAEFDAKFINMYQGYFPKVFTVIYVLILLWKAYESDILSYGVVVGLINLPIWLFNIVVFGMILRRLIFIEDSHKELSNKNNA